MRGPSRPLRTRNSVVRARRHPSRGGSGQCSVSYTYFRETRGKRVFSRHTVVVLLAPYGSACDGIVWAPHRNVGVVIIACARIACLVHRSSSSLSVWLLRICRNTFFLNDLTNFSGDGTNGTNNTTLHSCLPFSLQVFCLQLRLGFIIICEYVFVRSAIHWIRQE